MELDWTEELLSDSQEYVVELWDEPVADLRTLSVEVMAYRERIHREGQLSADVALADRLVEGTVALLDRVAAAPAEHRRMASVAARYFLREQDGASDLASIFGFDDDVEVFNAAAARIAPDLVIMG